MRSFNPRIHPSVENNKKKLHISLKNPFGALEVPTQQDDEKRESERSKKIEVLTGPTTKIYFGTSWALRDMEEEVLRTTAPHRRTSSQRAQRRRTSSSIEMSATHDTPQSALGWADVVDVGCVPTTSTCAVQSANAFVQWMMGTSQEIQRVERRSPRQICEDYLQIRLRTRSLIGKYIPLSRSTDTLVDTIESFAIFWYMMLNARTYADRYVAIAAHAKMLQAKMNETSLIWTVLLQAYEHFCPEEEMKVQSSTLPVFENLQMFLDEFERIKTSPVFAKLYKFSMYSMALSLFKPLGVDMDYLRFDEVAQEAIRKKYHLGPDFVHCVMDTLLFVAKRGYQCYQAGSIMPMFHSGAKYQEWFDEAEKLARQAQFLSNPDVHGIDRFKYLSDLKDVIERGRCMKKCTSQKDEKLLITRMMATLELTHDLEVTKRAAQADRRSPLTMLIYGGSGIGKSTLQKTIAQHYGKRRNLSTAPEFLYVRNPTDPFWSGYNATQWCIFLDDIGFLAPQLGMLDPTLAELLCIANNVPYVPNQAELADKGRTPVRAELCIGSTNTIHLNAVAMFSCPLAVQRRFPWVLDVRVKPEYQCVDRPGMLDSTKVPALSAGEYPDLWVFRVLRVEPVGEERLGQQGRYDEVMTTSSMRELMIWFNGVIDNHNSVQDQILRGNTALQETTLCDTCQLPVNWCQCVSVPQSAETEEELPAEIERPTYLEVPVETEMSRFLRYVDSCSILTRIVVWWYLMLYWLFVGRWYSPLVEFVLGSGWYAQLAWSSRHRSVLVRATLGFAGTRVQEKFGNVKTLAKFVSAVTACGLLYKSAGYLSSMLRTRPTPQGGVASHEFMKAGRVPTPDSDGVERPSYADPYPYNNADLSQATLCSRSQDGTLIAKHIETATCVFQTHTATSARIQTTTAVNVRGSVYMVNNHGIPASGDFYLDIKCEEKGTLSGSMRNLLVTESMVHRIPEHDLAFIRLRCRPCATDITKYFCKKNYVGRIDGTYFGRDVTGASWKLPIHNLKLESESWWSHGEVVQQPVWSGIVQEPTNDGDCGSLLLSQTPAGWVILGIHTLGKNNVAKAMKVALETVVAACDVLEPEYFNRGKPIISAPSAPRVLSDVSPQSVVHRVPQGVANVTGSFVGEAWKRSKTNVTETLIAPHLMKHGYRVTRFAPDMTKRPWELALRDTTRPVVLMNNTLLDTASAMYQKETHLSDLSQVHVYPLSVAINGCPGLQYCDKMNRTSSAGAPYKRSKRFYMHLIDETSTDMDVADEIKDAIQDIITTYQRGERAHAIFCGHLKDEPVTQDKRDSGKTRVFTASGMAYTLVVRMYLLSTIVFMQKNRFVYETGPGTVVQSLEWEEIRKYLVVHGEDRIVAGDYSKFDKRMPANVILAAFDIIADLCKRAGYTHEELMVVKGIAQDTAFPTVDFNGELIEFYGSNPSGHPLTVIVNGIANSLYMRYCYLVLRPIGCTKDFKEHVALMTYGDDNIMGVSGQAPWFNHTAIQKVLGDIDIGYTMADKEAASVPYIHISQANFLKRVWRWDDDVGAYVAPLDRSSIEKMLMVCVQKANVSAEYHAVQVIGTAVREYFWYGKKEFEEATEKFQEVVRDADLQLHCDDTVFPSWESLYNDFWARSAHIKRRVFTTVDGAGNDKPASGDNPLEKPRDDSYKTSVAGSQPSQSNLCT